MAYQLIDFAFPQMPVVLKERGIEEIVVFDEEEVRDTSTRVKTIDISQYSDWTISIANKTDSDVLNFKVQLGGPGNTAGSQKVLVGDQFEEVSKVIPKHDIYKHLLTKRDFHLEGVYGPSARFTFRHANAPTTGTVTIVLWGVKN